MERSAFNPDAAGSVPVSPPVAAASVPAAPAQGTPAQGTPAQDASVPAPAAPSHRDVREAWEMSLRRKKLVRWLVSWLPHRLTILIRSLLRVEHLVTGKVKYRWRRSLQLRVVGTTLVISATMIAVLGFFLTEQIAYGLLTNAENSAKTQALDGLNTARAQPGLTQQPTPESAQQFMTGIAQKLQPQNSGSPNYYVVIGLNSELADQAGYSPWVTSVDPTATLPPALVQDVRQEQHAEKYHGTAETLLYYAPTALTLNSGGQTESAIAVGAPVGIWYQLYYVVPLAQEQQTLQLVQTTLIGVGIALVALLVGHRLAGHPVGGAPGAARGQDGAAAGRGTPRGADAGRRRGRPRRARHLVQRDGGQPAGETAGAPGAVQGTASVRLRRFA